MFERVESTAGGVFDWDSLKMIRVMVFVFIPIVYFRLGYGESQFKYFGMLINLAIDVSCCFLESIRTTMRQNESIRYWGI